MSSEVPNIRQVTPFLHVPDLEAALAFFQDVLGLAKPFASGAGG